MNINLSCVQTIIHSIQVENCGGLENWLPHDMSHDIKITLTARLKYITVSRFSTRFRLTGKRRASWNHCTREVCNLGYKSIGVYWSGGCPHSKMCHLWYGVSPRESSRRLLDLRLCGTSMLQCFITAQTCFVTGQEIISAEARVGLQGTFGVLFRTSFWAYSAGFSLFNICWGLNWAIHSGS